VAVDLVLKQQDAGREAVSQGDLTRAIANRLTLDLSCTIGPMPPKSGGGIPEDTAAAPAPAAAAEPAPSTETPAADTALETTEGTASAELVFQAGVYGSDNELMLFASKVPPALAQPETADPFSGGVIDSRPDLRRITYYMSNKGLCREEKPWVTAENVRTASTADRNAELDLIAEEVAGISFSYFGKDGWTSSWSGSDTASDGGSVLGPPRAIKITMTLKIPGSKDTKTVSHVIPVRAATGLYQPPAAEPETTEPTTGATP
jgi:hypothetical protein